MSGLKSQVGPFKFQWKTVPHANEGVAEVEVEPGKTISVAWRKDAQGICLLLPNGSFGFDLQGEPDDEGRMLYHLTQRGTSHEWNSVLPIVGDVKAQGTREGSQNKALRVRAQMPGKILRVMVESGQDIVKDQPILVMEAMKMENEIRAIQSGKVGQIKVAVGQTVETGADLILIQN